MELDQHNYYYCSFYIKNWDSTHFILKNKNMIERTVILT